MRRLRSRRTVCFFFNDTPATEIYTLSLHDALPISGERCCPPRSRLRDQRIRRRRNKTMPVFDDLLCRYAHRRSEEHTSELQSRQYLVCRLLLEKKKPTLTSPHSSHLQFEAAPPLTA